MGNVEPLPIDPVFDPYFQGRPPDDPGAMAADKVFRQRLGVLSEHLLSAAHAHIVGGHSKETIADLVLYALQPDDEHFFTTKSERWWEVSQGVRRAVLLRDGHQCVHCGSEGGGEALHVDHIVPKSLGGMALLWNLQTLCARCNRLKSDQAV